MRRRTSIYQDIRSSLKKSPRIRSWYGKVQQTKNSVKSSAPVRHLYAEIDKHDALRLAESTVAMKIAYRRFHGGRFNEDSPQDFTDFLFRRMFEVNRSGNRLFTLLADKYRVREFVVERLGEEFLVPLLWSGRDPAEIPFDDLPQKYIVKANNGFGGHIVVDGVPDKPKIIAKVSAALKENYYRSPGAREFQYHAIEPRVLVEEFLDDGNEFGPLDYRFWCFGGVPHLIQVDDCVHGINVFYDLDWQKLDLSYRENFRDVDIPRPTELAVMLDAARKLSAGFDFVRVDLYLVHGRIYVGEMTLTPLGGRFRFTPDRWNRELGDLWRNTLAGDGTGRAGSSSDGVS